jgi:hypothetical protein
MMRDPDLDENADEADPELVRCLLCGSFVEKRWFDVHAAEECQMVGWERV